MTLTWDDLPGRRQGDSAVGHKLFDRFVSHQHLKNSNKINADKFVGGTVEYNNEFGSELFSSKLI